MTFERTKTSRYSKPHLGWRHKSKVIFGLSPTQNCQLGSILNEGGGRHVQNDLFSNLFFLRSFTPTRLPSPTPHRSCRHPVIVISDGRSYFPSSRTHGGKEGKGTFFGRPVPSNLIGNHSLRLRQTEINFRGTSGTVTKPKL